MNNIVYLWSYILAAFGTAIPIGLLAYEITQQIQERESVISPFTVEFAAVVALTVMLEWVLRSILDAPSLMLLFWGVFAMWLASMVWWIYDTLRRSAVTLIITEI
jgi:hypothetical protein